ncbi:MAG: metal ABC transporter ATP-binding protein [Chloroflexi bacterium]|nr:MAG: metal ABC transporter ATP-binding protein [Chloroflexota bacterium]MBL1194511.1 metal ABC transporter ATP-binding protein [Chloroflexota bacterium]NOH11799.1 metal ABC transporter ATP-binding protein [Chloroflexota bacterium]
MVNIRGIERAQPHKAKAPALEAIQLTRRYEGDYALEDVSFQVDRGERVAVVGPNGAGKSTLFQIVAGVLASSSGEVKVFGHKPLGHICIAYVSQRNEVDYSFPASVFDVVMMGRIGILGFFHNPRQEDRDYVTACLETVGMADLAHRQISELSGGQQQRMFIARALAQEAELMLMDEPLTGLDVVSQEGILDIMDELRQREVTVLVATHDLNLAAENFDKVMLLNHKLIGYGPVHEVFTPENLSEAYGGHLQLVETDDGMVVVGDTHVDGPGGHSHA